MRPVFLAAALLAAGALTACASAPAAVSPAAVSAAAIDAVRLSEHTRILSDDRFQGRGIATPEEQMVIDYMSRNLAEAGFAPGGENGGWTQAVTLNRYAVSNPTVSLRTGDWRRDLVVGQDVVVSARRPAGAVRLDGRELVFVGYGTVAPERQWDDFKGQDMTGKILVVLVNDADFEQPELDTFNGRAMTYYGRWTYKYEEAARQGAAGVIIVHETAPASYGWATVTNSWSGPQFDIERQNVERERTLMEAWIQRDVAVDLFERAGLDFEALKVQARSRDFQPTVLTGVRFDAAFDVATEQVVTHNIIGRLEGSRHPDETILYTGHWDHIGVGEPDANGDRIFNGAVDNASGIAGLLELARLWGAGPRPERSIVIVGFTAEESGLLGSEFYAANPLYPLETTVGGFNIDSMNVYGRVAQMGVTGYGQSNLDERLETVSATQGRTLAPDHNNAAGTYFRSDHFPLAKRGVPMAYAGGRGDFRDAPVADREARRSDYGANRYHQAADEWAADMDFSGAAEDLEVFYAIGRDLADSRDWPQWKAGSEFGPARAASAAARR